MIGKMRSTHRLRGRHRYYPAAIARGCAVVLATLLMIYVLIEQYSTDHITPARYQTDFWPSDGHQQKLSAARAAITTTPIEAEALASSILLSSPLNIQALEILARTAIARNDVNRADAIVDFLLRRTRHNLFAISYRLYTAVKRDDPDIIIDAADIMLRAFPDSRQAADAITLLISLSDSERGLQHIAAILKEKPIWHGTYLNALATTGTVSTFPTLMEKMRGEADTSFDTFWSLYLNRLIAAGDGLSAYAHWVDLVGGHHDVVPYVFNGRFNTAPTGLPFDWTLAPLRGVTMGVGNDPDDDKKTALHLAFASGRLYFSNVSQIVALSPGSYVVSGTFKTRALKTTRGLRWRLLCLPERADHSTIGMSPPVTETTSWTTFAFDVTVPPKDCDLQRLQLFLSARLDSERVISGQVWFSDISIASSVASPTGPLIMR